ncbi:hypothetical protein BD770DRAFT_384432 [Pilaira anomala]|nr:hypothetical protein BD770DRAFT_384432 [Pilaira anomala]
MSDDNDKQQQQQQQNAQEQQFQDLNFSINDILSHNHDVNDSSFQSIVQTLSNTSNEHITPSYAHLPAELQDLLSNETDDLLSPQGSTSDASMLTNDIHLWSQPSFISSPVLNQPSPALSTPPILPPPQQHQQTPPPPPPPSSSASSTPQTPVNNTNHSANSTPTISAAAAAAAPTPTNTNTSAAAPASSTTLLDNITAQLPAEKKDRFIQLFRRLQSSSVTADDFLLQAKSLLGQQQYQQLEDLKNKPSRFPAATTTTTTTTSSSPVPQTQQQQQKALPIRPAETKRILTSSQIRAEDAQRSMPGIM